jgi:hypothetical protein
MMPSVARTPPLLLIAAIAACASELERSAVTFSALCADVRPAVLQMAEALTLTEVDRMVSFALAAGETKYLRTSPSFGVLVGRINFDLVNAPEALAEVTVQTPPSPAR